MLLRLLYDLAHSPNRHILSDLAFAPKSVRWIIELDANGIMLGAGPQSTGDDKRGKEFSCPQTTRSKVAGGVAEFLADGLTAIFGLDTDPEARMTEKKRADRDANNARKQEDFWRQVQRASDQTSIHTMTTLLAFHEAQKNQLEFLRWGVSSNPKPAEKSAWWVRTASGTEVKLGPDNFTFRVNGQLLLEDDNLRDWWRSVHASEVQQARASFQTGLCLISGSENVPLAPTHSPKIQGVPNTQSFGAAIVSFDKDAFASYGFDQSLNAPTSEDAATAYCSALNWLLERKDHHLRLAQTSLCFWTRASERASGLFAHLLNQPDPQSVAQLLKSPWAGIEPSLPSATIFTQSRSRATLAVSSSAIGFRNPWTKQSKTFVAGLPTCRSKFPRVLQRESAQQHRKKSSVRSPFIGWPAPPFAKPRIYALKCRPNFTEPHSKARRLQCHCSSPFSIGCTPDSFEMKTTNCSTTKAASRCSNSSLTAIERTPIWKLHRSSPLTPTTLPTIAVVF